MSTYESPGHIWVGSDCSSAGSQSKVKCAPATERMAVTACRKAPANAAGFLMPFQPNQSPENSQPSRIVAFASPPATSFWATVTYFASYAPEAACSRVDTPSSGINGMDQTWCTLSGCHQPMLPIAVMPAQESTAV